jgi:glycerol kinase
MSRLVAGRPHATDAGNASRSMLCRLDTLEWSDELADLFGVPVDTLPAIRDSDADFGEIARGIAGAGIPILAALGDQQASLFGQSCWTAGQAKATLGTGAFVWAHAGTTPPPPPPGTTATCAWRLGGLPAYALEGIVPSCGAAIDWLVDLGILQSPSHLDELLSHASADDETIGVLALHGLGTPTLDHAARGAILGLTRGTTAADLARGAVDGIAHQLVDAIEAMAEAGPITDLRLDGGLSRSRWTPQRIADLAAIPIQRSRQPESTALGAAVVAGLRGGLWPSLDEVRSVMEDATDIHPAMPEQTRAMLRRCWVRARDLTVAERPQA